MIDNISKPLASISLDLDNLWSYLKTHGDLGWESFPSYLDTFVPLVLDVLDELGLKITFFVVGQDAALEKNHDVIRLIVEKGHEVGNHSFNHEPWLHLYPKDQIKTEILQTEQYIQKITGQKPVGFRGPGFSWSPQLLEVLVENGYVFDASTLPTYIGPLARAYYFLKSDLSAQDKEKRNKLFGGFSDGLKPIKPYYLQLMSNEKIMEIPVTTLPVFKTPFHLSYLVYLSSYSKLLMLFYLELALQMCRTFKTGLSFLLHPLDLLGRDNVRELGFFPGMNFDSAEKQRIFLQVMKRLLTRFRLTNMSTFADFISHNSGLKTRKCPSA